MEKVVKVIPIKAPIRCVVCNGFGSLSWGKKVCQACSGKGFILVDAEEIKEDKN